MTLWIAILALALGGAAAALWPVLRGVRGEGGRASGEAGERAVLRAALAENEADRAAGRIGGADAEAARAELGRRLLALERDARGGVRPGGERGPNGSRPVVPVLAALLVPLGAFALYGAIGSPGARDLPVAARSGPAVTPEESRALLARLESHLAENPEDARGWAVIAPIYRRMGEGPRATEAFERALPALEGADRAYALTELVELTVLRDGAMDAVARARLDEALRLDPTNGKAGFYLAADVETARGRDAGLAAWRGLVERHRLAAPDWLPAARARIAALEAMPAGSPPPGPSSASPGPSSGPSSRPSPSDVAAAARASETMNERDRTAMIEGMVAGLAARLEAQPDDAEGWERLVRSYIVLGRREDAAAALERADAALGEGAARLAPLRAELDGARTNG